MTFPGPPPVTKPIAPRQQAFYRSECWLGRSQDGSVFAHAVVDRLRIVEEFLRERVEDHLGPRHVANFYTVNFWSASL